MNYTVSAESSKGTGVGPQTPDPKGRERFLADPMVDYTASGFSYLPANQLASWGLGIALVARHLAA